MSDSSLDVPPENSVSPLRKRVSAAILILLLCVLTIEGRAALGQLLSRKALEARSPDGAFDDMTHEEAKALLKLAPTETIVRETADEIEYRYAWFSLLRPLLGKPEAAYYVVVDRSNPPEARRYTTDPPSEEDHRIINTTEDPFADPVTSGAEGIGPAGGGGWGRPAEDPLLMALDSDGSGELSEEEIAGAAAALLKVDKNGDGQLSEDEVRPSAPTQGLGGGPRRRPPMEDDQDDSTTHADADSGTESPTAE